MSVAINHLITAMLSRAQLYLNIIFYLDFRKELLILIEANFGPLLHCPHFLLRFKKCVLKNLYLPTRLAL